METLDRKAERLRDICYTSPAALARDMRRQGFALPAHIRAINQALLDLWAVRGDKHCLLLGAPPRHGKSTLSTIYFPAWAILMQPWLSVGIASYGATLSESWTRVIRDVLVKYGPAVGVYVDERASVSEFVVRHDRGARYEDGLVRALGVTSGLIGRGLDLLCADDLVKDLREATSPLMRERVWDWLTGVVESRFSPEAKMIVTMARWSNDDPIGRLQEMAKKSPTMGVSELFLPAIARDNDPLGRKPGEALWPERWSIARLRQIEVMQGPIVFSAQYLQSPQHQSGDIFKREWFRLWPLNMGEPDPEFVLISLDTAFTESEQNSATGWTEWGIVRTSEGHQIAILMTAEEKFLAYPELRAKVIASYKNKRWGKNRRKCDELLIEKKGSGISLLDDLARAEINAAFYNPFNADKISRAHMVSHIVAEGCVCVRQDPDNPGQPHPDIKPYIEQMTTFPRAKRADLVDSTTQALSFLRHRHLIGLTNEAIRAAEGEDPELGEISERYSIYG